MLNLEALKFEKMWKIVFENKINESVNCALFLALKIMGSRPKTC
jgi:hypothetical protein